MTKQKTSKEYAVDGFMVGALLMISLYTLLIGIVTLKIMPLLLGAVIFIWSVIWAFQLDNNIDEIFSKEKTNES